MILSGLVLSGLILKTDLFDTLHDSLNSRKEIFNCTINGIKNNGLIGIGNHNIKEYIANCNPSLGKLDTHNLFWF